MAHWPRSWTTSAFWSRSPKTKVEGCTRAWSWPMIEPLSCAYAFPRLSLGAVITIGTFDGVHLGHRDLLARVARRAAERRLPSLLVTFEPHPLEVVNPSAAPLLLTTTSEKLEAIAESGVDYAAVLPFTGALASLDPAAFVEKILLDRFCLRELLIGHDHGFGRGRAGDIHVLRELGERHDFDVGVVDAVVLDGAPVSSSAIRRAVSYGELEAASHLLGGRYAFSGRVVHGDERGRQLGFPTLNIALTSVRKLLPPAGVYAVYLRSER